MERIKPYNVLRKGCLSRDVLEIIGDKWTVLVLHVLQAGPLRYSAIGRAVGGITQKMLTATLRNLERDGIVSRTIFPVIPPKVEYALTPRGESLLTTLESLVGWAEEHADEVRQSRQAYRRL